ERTVQQRDRRPSGRRRDDGEDACLEHPAEARRSRPRAGRDRRLRRRPRPRRDVAPSRPRLAQLDPLCLSPALFASTRPSCLSSTSCLQLDLLPPARPFAPARPLIWYTRARASPPREGEITHHPLRSTISPELRRVCADSEPSLSRRR